MEQFIYIRSIFCKIVNIQNIIFLLLFCTSVAYSDPGLHIALDGLVTKENQRLGGAIITLVDMEEYPNVTRSIITPNNGKFIFKLNPGKEYMILASKKGLVTKKILFSTENISEGRVANRSYTFLIEISLFEEADGLDISLLENPVGKIIYNDKINDFEVDKKYARSIRPELKMLQKELLAIRKKSEKEKMIEKVNLANAKKAKENKVIPFTVSGAKPLSAVRKPATEALETAYRSLPSIEHPDAVTEETIMDGNKKIIIRIVIQKGRSIEYKMVAHPWGAVFYFKNGRSIAKHIFELETRK